MVPTAQQPQPCLGLLVTVQPFRLTPFRQPAGCEGAEWAARAEGTPLAPPLQEHTKPNSSIARGGSVALAQWQLGTGL